MSIPRDQWPKWAECPACRRHWNVTGKFSFAFDSPRAAEWFAAFHERNCVGAAGNEAA